MGIYPLARDEMKSEVYEFLPELFLRAPFYSFEKYDLAALPQVLQQSYFQNALWLASPLFHGLIKSKEFDYDLLSDKEKFTLAKYFNRICYRPTPFGSFATFTNLAWEQGTPVILTDNESAILHLLPDREISKTCFRSKRPFNAYTPVIRNPTIYPFGDHLRFIATAAGPKGRYRFFIDQIEGVDFNLNLLKQLSNGPVDAGKIEDWIAGNADCTRAEANDYLRFLIEDQLLYTPDQGSVISHTTITGQESTRLWQHWRNRKFSEVGSLETTANDVAQLFAKRDDGSRNAYFYTAAERPLVSGGIDPEDQSQLMEGLRILEPLASPPPMEALKSFIKDFQSRFDLEKVPLLKAIDPDMGIAYGDRATNPAAQQLLKNIRFPESKEKITMPWERSRQFFLQLWLNNARRNSHDPIMITEQDISNLTIGNEKQFPPSVAVMFRKTECQILIESVGGASATQLIGRFSMFSDSTAELCRKIAQIEQAANPGVVFADIEQISDQYVDNINQRKPVYAYVIPLNVCSETPLERQLLPDDLYLSVRSGELILESKSLGMRVIPRLASAYNYHHNEQPLFRLLGDLQFQNLNATIGLDLALLFPGLSFYPRVTYRKVVLSTAQWILKSGEITVLTRIISNGVSGEIIAFRNRLGMPAMITVGEHDQQLVVNLDNSREQIFFFKWLKGKQEVRIKEYLMPDESLQSNGDTFAGQYIGFLIQYKPVYQPLLIDTHRLKKIQRQFIPGSDWLYVKIYCTPGSANILLQKMVWPLIQQNKSRIRSWFFIRYSDPGQHLRLRIRVHGNDVGKLLVALKMQIKKQGVSDLVGKLSCETYHREVERYGAKYIVATEAVFRAGSDLVAALIHNGQTDRSEMLEMRWALTTAFEFISIFYRRKNVAAAFVEEVTNSFLMEFKADKNLKIDLDNKYRKLSNDIELWLSKDGLKGESLEIQQFYQVLFLQVRNINEMIPIKAYLAKKRMLADLVHMQINRTFTQGQRQKELLIYYCLKKYLASQIARSKKLTQAG